MSTTLNEFALTLPITGIASVSGMAVADEPKMSSLDITSCSKIPDEVDATAHQHISISVESAQPVNYDPTSACVLIDLVLSVGVNNPSTNTSNYYKVVKRLSLDKVKVACEAEQLVPIHVVEAEEDPVKVEKEMQAYFARVRAQEMAGIYESEGHGEAVVQFNFADTPEAQAVEKNGASARASSSVVIKNVKDKAHARHVFMKKHAHKYKDTKIVRVTFKEPTKVE